MKGYRLRLRWVSKTEHRIGIERYEKIKGKLELGKVREGRRFRFEF